MECLTNLVGLDGCESATAPFTLNQIGYSTNQIEQFMDDSYSTVDEFLTANKRTAAQMLISDFFGMVSGGSFTKQIIDSSIAGLYPDQTLADSVSGIRGISLKLYGQSEYWKININAVTLYADSTGDVDISLYNLTTGEILTTKTISTVAGTIASVDFDYVFESNMSAVNLFIGYDTTGVSPYTASVFLNTCCGKKPVCTTSFASVQGAELVSPFYYNSVTQKSTTAGLTVAYSIECNNTAYLCSIKSILGLAMLYRTAMCILDYSKDSSSQFSQQQTINADGNEDRWTRAEYLYNRELKKIMNQVTLPSNRCFYCSKRVSFKSNLPA